MGRIAALPRGLLAVTLGFLFKKTLVRIIRNIL